MRGPQDWGQAGWSWGAVDRGDAQQRLQGPTVRPDPDRARLWEGAGALTPPDQLHVPAVSTRLDAFAAIDHSLLGAPAFTEEYGDVALKVKSPWASLGQIWEQGSLADPHITSVCLCRERSSGWARTSRDPQRCLWCCLGHHPWHCLWFCPHPCPRHCPWHMSPCCCWLSLSSLPTQLPSPTSRPGPCAGTSPVTW